MEGSGEIFIEGRALAWRRAGAGPPLLLVNGYAATAADWDPTFLSGLGEAFQVICPDSRGMGGSALGDPAEVSMEGMAADLQALLDALGIERLPVVGWSMGGFVAQRLAARAPGRVAALVLLSTDAGGPEAVRAEPEVWKRLTSKEGTPREQASRLISLLFPEPLAGEIDRRFGEVVASARAQLDAEALRAQERAMDAWHAEARPAPPAGSAPLTLAVAGSEDVVIPPRNLDLLAARWPGSRVECFDGGGHAFMAQEPRRLSRLIASFVSERVP